MFAFVRFDSLISVAPLYQTSCLDSFSSRIMQHIKEIATSIFNRMSELFNSYKKYSNESNLKTFALISCLSLIALLVISMLRRRDSQTILPPPEEVT